MNRWWILLVVVASVAAPASASSYFLAPDSPMEDPSAPGENLTPWQILRNEAGVYSVVETLPEGVAIDALYRLTNGDWLFSVDAAAELPPGSGVQYGPADVVRWDGVAYSLYFDAGAAGLGSDANVDALYLSGGDNGDLVLSFEQPTTAGSGLFEPADLVRYSGGTFSIEFDASGASPPVPVTANLIGADERANSIIITFDTPVTLGTDEFFPGQLVAWDRVSGTFSLFLDDPSWPGSCQTTGLSFPPPPGSVGPTVRVVKSVQTPGDLTISWQPGCSSGAEDYGIYEGDLSDIYSHVPITCTDAGSDFTEEVTPSPGNRYYLVVPHNANDEGGYGTDSGGVERPHGASACSTSWEPGDCW